MNEDRKTYLYKRIFALIFEVEDSNFPSYWKDRFLLTLDILCFNLYPSPEKMDLIEEYLIDEEALFLEIKRKEGK